MKIILAEYFAVPEFREYPVKTIAKILRFRYFATQINVVMRIKRTEPLMTLHNFLKHTLP